MVILMVRDSSKRVSLSRNLGHGVHDSRSTPGIGSGVYSVESAGRLCFLKGLASTQLRSRQCTHHCLQNTVHKGIYCEWLIYHGAWDAPVSINGGRSRNTQDFGGRIMVGCNAIYSVFYKQYTPSVSTISHTALQSHEMKTVHLPNVQCIIRWRHRSDRQVSFESRGISGLDWVRKIPEIKAQLRASMVPCDRHTCSTGSCLSMVLIHGLNTAHRPPRSNSQTELD